MPRWAWWLLAALWLFMLWFTLIHVHQEPQGVEPSLDVSFEGGPGG